MNFHLDNLKTQLKNEIEKFQKVRLIRSPVRIGLIKARMMGAVNAEGPALIFMDSHIEVTEGWLEPLLDRLAIDRRTVPISVMDTIDMDNMQFKFVIKPEKTPVTGFDWSIILKFL
jgi:polypeptide N-acetylgalactosaminyltransferase